MKTFLKAIAGAFAGLTLAVTAGAGYIYTQRDALLQMAVSKASEFATKTLGTRVEIGNAVLGDITSGASDISVTDLAVYDKNSELIARAEKADINFRLLDLYTDPASAVDEITVTRAEAFVTKRDDGTWNFSDIKTSEGETNFNADIKLIDSKLRADLNDDVLGVVDAENLNATLNFDGTKNIYIGGTADKINTSYDANAVELDNVETQVRIDGFDNIKAHVKSKAFDNNLIVDVSMLGSYQTYEITADRADFDDILPFVPVDKIPDGVEILGGQLSKTHINIARRGDEIKFNGKTDVFGGSVRVEDTIIDAINGSTIFNNKEIQLAASLAANDQFADVSGKIKIDGETPYFDIHATSDRFRPSAVIANIPVDSVAAFTAQLTGTTDRPLVEADIEVPSIAYNGLYASNISTHFKYFDNAVYLSDLSANTFGGSIKGDAELQASDLAFNAHVKTFGIDAGQLVDYVPALEGMSGEINADLGINGVGDDLHQLKVYGSANATDIYVRDIPITQIDTSFYAQVNELRIDYLSMAMPNRGSIGVEGTIKIGRALDLNFYGGHVDLSFINNLLPPSIASGINVARNDVSDQSTLLPIAYAQPLPQLISGLSDFKGKITGSLDNPAVDVKFTAIDNSKREGEHFKGMFINQPYDSVKFSASGSLAEVRVDDFSLTKEGTDHWTAKGTVGLTGEQKIDLQVDTESVRAEDIIALVAPDQELTGNVDNIIKITGTLEKPEVVGYIHFWRGSYRGMLVNNMDGDYFVEGNKIRVQDFHVNTPMIDMDLNGTIDKITTDMDFVVIMHDIDMKRIEGKLPEGYPASGHGRFEGIIRGTLESPIFDGNLMADSLSFNGVEINNVSGDVGLNGCDILLNSLQFTQGAGTYNVHGAVNYQSGVVHGASEVKNADIKNLLALSNYKTELFDGALDSKIRFGGSMSNPSLNISGTIPRGTIAGNEVRDIVLELNLINRVAYVNKLEAFQGENGSLKVAGSGDLYGPLNLSLIAENLSLGMFMKAAGLDLDIDGSTSLTAKVIGNSYDPIVHAELLANGSGKDATFDTLQGDFDLKNGIVTVNNLFVNRTIDEKLYQASAKGSVPFSALSAKTPAELNDSEQLDITLTLDDADLSLLPVLNDYVAWAMGPMQGQLKVTGTAANPLVKGKISVLDGTTKIKNVKSLIEHMNMTLNFTGNRMTVERFDGNIGSGTYKLEGGFGFAGLAPTDYDFKFIAEKLQIRSSFFDGPLSMEFTFNEANFFRDRKLPKLAGHIDFDNCRITVPSIPESDDELPLLLLDVKINLGDKVHFYSPYLYDMKLIGDIHYEGTTQRPKSSGTISVKRGGTLNYLKTIFKIQEGEASFNQMESFFPSLLFDAEAKLTQAKVFLHLDGTLDAMNFKLTSSPEMTQEEIMQLLTLRDAYQKNGETELDAQDILTLGLQLSFLSELEGMVRKTFGFDQFTISRGSGSAFEHRGREGEQNEEEEYNVQMGKYITDNVMLKYTRGIGGDNINRYGFQYDFNNNMGVTIERENHDFIFGLEARWKF